MSGLFKEGMMRRLMFFLTMMICYATAWGQYHVGDIYSAPDGSHGVVFYISPDGTYGWAVALQDASLGCAWGDNSMATNHLWTISYVPALLEDTSAYENTQALLFHQGTGTEYVSLQPTSP